MPRVSFNPTYGLSLTSDSILLIKPFKEQGEYFVYAQRVSMQGNSKTMRHRTECNSKGLNFTMTCEGREEIYYLAEFTKLSG